jgi:hypothetical protein
VLSLAIVTTLGLLTVLLASLCQQRVKVKPPFRWGGGLLLLFHPDAKRKLTSWCPNICQERRDKKNPASQPVCEEKQLGMRGTIEAWQPRRSFHVQHTHRPRVGLTRSWKKVSWPETFFAGSCPTSVLATKLRLELNNAPPAFFCRLDSRTCKR